MVGSNKSRPKGPRRRHHPTTSVLLLDDHAVVREGLRALIDPEDDLEVCEEAATLADALNAVCRPDAVLADLVLPDARGVEVVEQLRARFPAARILVLSMMDDPALVQLALFAGASGFIAKEAAATDVLEGIRRVARGEEYLDPSLGAAVASRLEERRRSGAATEALSPREREVLSLLALGHTNNEVAEILHVSLRTVETHRSHILDKLGLRTRAELVRFAAEAGLIDSPTPQI